MNENTYIIGDVHGCFYTLTSLLAKLPKDAEIIFVGDLCDKGNYTKEVIELVIERGYKCVKGNHEYLMRKNIENALDGGICQWCEDESYGGNKTVSSYRDDREVMYRHLEWIDKLPLYLMIDKYFVTHGYGLPYFQRRDDPQYAQAILANRIDSDKHISDWENVEEHDVFNIFGHSPFEQVKQSTQYAGIDTGCVYGGRLTAFHLFGMDIVQVDRDARDGGL